MKYLNSYVPSQVRCKIFGIPIEGFSESNIVDIERENDVTTFRKAMDGSRTAFKDKYGSYRLTFHVNQTSEANTWLHLLFKLYKTLAGLVAEGYTSTEVNYLRDKEAHFYTKVGQDSVIVLQHQIDLQQSL